MYMKKILFSTILIGMAFFSANAQELKTIPYSTEIKQLPDGWHKFALQGVTFDVEVKAGTLIKGNIVWLDGTKYSGSLLGATLSGKGTYTWPDGTRYEGTFRKGQRHGKGSQIQIDNSRRSGKWKNNQKNGKGKQFGTSGEVVQQGVWEGDQYLGAKKK